jgi:hypothetical protein
MCAIERFRLFLALMLGSLMCSCASLHAPPGWLPPARSDQVDSFGGWIQLRTTSAAGSVDLSGELIALDADSLFVLSSAELRAVALNEIARADVIWYDSEARLAGLWTVLGTLSTPSHGVGLIISAPVWIVIGGLATSAQSWQGRVKWPDKDWETIRAYCRFPQGLPPGIDRRALLPRVYSPPPTSTARSARRL